MADDSSLVASIAEKSEYFNSLVELIPAKYYLPDDALDSTKSEEAPENISRQRRKQLIKKAKLLRLDPSQHKTVADLQKEIEKKEREAKLGSNGLTSFVKPLRVSDVPSAPVDELRKKLHERLSELKRKRKVSSSEGGAHLEKKRKRKHKKEKDRKSKKTEKDSNTKNTVNLDKKPTQTKIVNENGDLVFSKFDFAATNDKRTGKGKKKKNKIKNLLTKAEKQKEKIDAIEKDDKEKAKELKTSITWDKALKHAEGEKVKDDPRLLKKSMKRQEKIKEKSSKKWMERIEHQNKQKEDKQKLRKQHLQERKDAKFKRKLGKKGLKKHKPGF